MKNSTQKRVLGIIGSPRRNGNTEILVDEVLIGAEEAGASTEKITLSNMNILPCLGCGTCQKTDKCVQQDDLPIMLEKMTQSHVWVLGTPVYWNGPTGQFKTFMDRWYSAKQETFKDKKIILTIPMGAGDERCAQHTIGMITDSLGKQRIFAAIIATNSFRLGAVRLNNHIMKEARRVGRNVISKE